MKKSPHENNLPKPSRSGKVKGLRFLIICSVGLLVTVHDTPLADLLIIEPNAHRDARGFFMETWRDAWLEKLRTAKPFVQDNHASSSTKGILRGLHFQKPPHAQAKLVWVTRGAVFDVAVDLRAGSPSFGKWHGLVLSAENLLRLFVPRGFAHGYMTLESDTEFQYKVDAYYNAASEGGVRWDDPDLAIAWPSGMRPVLSEKDRELPAFSAFSSPFVYSGM